MAYEQINRTLSFQVASLVAPNTPVFMSASTAREVVPCSTHGQRPVGVTGDVGSATVAASRGFQVGVHTNGNVVRAIAAASLGNGAEVGVASTNGALGPVQGASGASVWSVGQAVTSAAAGSKFTIIVQPRQLSNLA